MNFSEERFDLESLENQTKGTDLFSSDCTAVDDMKLLWK